MLLWTTAAQLTTLSLMNAKEPKCDRFATSLQVYPLCVNSKNLSGTLAQGEK
ncbi:hypothetical protein [Calothrix rhizosoleniae]|uniref:hypothetical protein n=1 Tax=Calothrix rhizosoleniae TaxID=888997 RepID=UPI00135636BE